MHAVLLILVAVVTALKALVLRHRCADARREAEADWERRHEMAADLAAAVGAVRPEERRAIDDVLRALDAARHAHDLGDRVQREARLGIALTHLRACAERDPRLRGSGTYVVLGLRLGEIEEDLADDTARLLPSG